MSDRATRYAADAFVQYVETALRSSVDDDGEPLDARFDWRDVSFVSLVRMRSELGDFVRANLSDLDGMDPEQAGHGFWLTRNRHGVGFWDRGLGDRGDRLSDASKVYGSSDLYVGDDGAVHVM